MNVIIETARLNRPDPKAYLRAVIARIADHPINRVAVRVSDFFVYRIRSSTVRSRAVASALSAAIEPTFLPVLILWIEFSDRPVFAAR